MINLRDGILEAGLLERVDQSFASGLAANNHLNIDKLDQHHDLFERVTSAMAVLILAHSCEPPKFLAPIPSGGDIFADTIAQKLAVEDKVKVPVIKFQKSSDGLFIPASGFNARKLENLDGGVIIDDVSTTYSSLIRFLDSPSMRGKTNMKFCAVWHRGYPEIERDVDIEKFWVVEEPIQPRLPDDSPFWRYVTETKSV